MAEVENSNDLLTVSGTDFDTFIWQPSIPEKNTIFHKNIYTSAASQISSSQVNSAQIRSSQVSIPQSSLTQISPSQMSKTEIGVDQIGISKIARHQIGMAQNSSHEATVAQIGSHQIDSSKVGSHQIDSSKVGFFEGQVNTSNVDSNEGSFPSSIEFEQLFTSNLSSKTKSVHNSTSEIINALNNSATNIDSFDEQNIEPEAIYGIKSTNIPLTNIPDSLWVSSLNPTYAIGDRTIQMKHGKLQ